MVTQQRNDQPAAIRKIRTRMIIIICLIVLCILYLNIDWIKVLYHHLIN